ncbi:hypothetical protein [uncultured Shimia sp.]|uniref:hypothetical protein n=1 Tax=uncultured Shimia sp. TaxID=573152 RepID=UPI0025F40A5F|nr:hypothetical protein [uncultured Shimia sp.]
MKVMHFRTAALKALVVLVPSYVAAYFSDKMVWVVPTLAASSFFAASIGVDEKSYTRRVDEETDDSNDAENYEPVESSEAIEGG